MTIAWYRLHRYAWQRNSAIVIFAAKINIKVMAQLTLQVDSPSLFEQLKNVLSYERR